MRHHNYIAPAYVAGIGESVRCLRQFNYCCIIMGAAPSPADEDMLKEVFASHSARLQSLAANSFNRGLRAYYFALAMMLWFVNSWAFLGAAAIVVAVLFRREFHSKSLSTLADALGAR